MKRFLYLIQRDACDTCIKHNVGNLTKAEYQLHIERKELARQEKSKNKKAEIGECVALTTDLQVVKLSPFFNEVHYTTKPKYVSIIITLYSN